MLTKIYIVDCGFDEYNTGFYTRLEAENYAEAIGVDADKIKEFDLASNAEKDEYSIMFMCNFFDNEFKKPRLYPSHPEYAFSITIDNPTSLCVIVESNNIKAAKEMSRYLAIKFLEKALEDKTHIQMGATYSLETNEVICIPKTMTPVPMIEPMIKQLLCLIKGETDEARRHSTEAMLLFWASPSSEDGLYRFKLSDEVNGRLSFYQPCGGSASKNPIMMRREDVDEFLDIAKNIGFEKVESKDEDVLCLRRI